MAVTVTIAVNGREHEVEVGLTSGNALLALANAGDAALLLVRDGDVNTPVLASDHVLVHGGESFVTATAATDTTSALEGHVTPKFNGSRELCLSTGKMLAEDLKRHDDGTPSGRLFAVSIKDVDIEIFDGTTIVVQETDSYLVVPHPADAPDEVVVDIEECARHGRRPPKWHRYRIRVDRDKFVVASRFVTGADILALVDKLPGEWALNQKLHGGRRIRIEPGHKIDLAERGLERFETVRRQAQQGDG